MGLPHTVQLVVVRRQSIGMILRRPAGAGVRADRERTELVEGEHSVGEVGGDVLNPRKLGVPVRVGGLFPGLGPLEGDVVLMQQLA